MRPASTIAAAASRLRLFSLRELAVHRRRTIASIAVMAVSAMYLVAIFGIFGSITGSVNRLADGVAGIAALEVSGITDAGFPDSIAADVAAVPGVATAAPMIRMSAPTPTEPVLLFGADNSTAELGGALKDAVSRPIEETVRGARRRPGRPGRRSCERREVPTGLGRGHGHRRARGQATRGSQRRAIRPRPTYVGAEHYRPTRSARLDSDHHEPGADLAAVRASVTSAVNGRAIVAAPSMRAARPATVSR